MATLEVRQPPVALIQRNHLHNILSAVSSKGLAKSNIGLMVDVQISSTYHVVGYGYGKRTHIVGPVNLYSHFL